MPQYFTTAVQNFLYRIAAEIKNEAQLQAPYVTGNLRNDIKVIDDHIAAGIVEIGNSLLAPYAPYVHEGTGIYGPKKRKITPKHAKALKIPVGGGYTYRSSTKGQKPNPYMQHGLTAYIQKGGLQQAETAFADTITDHVTENVRQALQTKITIKFA